MIDKREVLETASASGAPAGSGFLGCIAGNFHLAHGRGRSTAARAHRTRLD
jgi:hypothetical protein